MTRIEYPCYHTGRWDKPIGVCDRKAKKGDMWACPHLLAGGTWENCEAGGKREKKEVGE